MKRKAISIRRMGQSGGWLALVFLTLVSCKSTQWQAQSVQRQQLAISQSLAGSPKVDALIRPYKDSLSKVISAPLAYSAEVLTKDTVEGLLGDFVADGLLAFCRSRGVKADLLFTNNGGLRSALPKGVVRIGDIYEVLPFENELVVMTLSPNEFLKLLQYAAARKNLAFAGMRWKLDRKTGRPREIQIVSASGQATLWDEKSSITVVTSDYLAKGGDQMAFLNGIPFIPQKITLRDALIQFLQSQGQNFLISIKKDFRLILEN